MLTIGIVMISYACYLIGKNKSHKAEAKTKQEPKVEPQPSNSKKWVSSLYLSGPNKYGRLDHAIGKFGYYVSNPICINTIGDEDFFSYMENMTDGKGKITGYAVVSVCLCSLFPGKVLNKLAVRLSDEKTFVTLYMVETNKFTSRYYPDGLMSKSSLSEAEYFGANSNIRLSLRVDRELEAIKAKESREKGLLPSREKVIEYSMPVRRVGESDHYFSQRVEAYRFRQKILEEYQKILQEQKKKVLYKEMLELNRILVNRGKIDNEEYEGKRILEEYLHGE